MSTSPAYASERIAAAIRRRVARPGSYKADMTRQEAIIDRAVMDTTALALASSLQVAIERLELMLMAVKPPRKWLLAEIARARDEFVRAADTFISSVPEPEE